MNPYEILNSIINDYKIILADNLVGVYLHGSLAMGCYNQNSDIDFIVVIKNPLSFEISRDLIAVLLSQKNVPKKGLEMSVVIKKYTQSFVYPTPFELHYSKAHQQGYLKDSSYICGKTVDKDLAAHFTIINHDGVCLYGESIEDVFSPVPKEFYIDSIINDIKDIRKNIFHNPTYYILNSCRIFHYLKENKISSKLKGGLWARNALPSQFTNCINNALLSYSKAANIKFSNQNLAEFAEYILNTIDILAKKNNYGVSR